MINLFSGEFLFHAVPLEMSMNACSHQCVYCFANLKNGQRAFDTKSFSNQMNKLLDSKTFLSNKLKQKYSVCISNNTDPFSKNNINITEGVLETLQQKKIPVYFQTKTGYRFRETLKDFPKSDFYISITSTNDELSKRIEPNAPVFSERVEHIKWLLENGHNVGIGFNPLREEWISKEELENAFKLFYRLGIKGFMVQNLSVKSKNIERLQKRDFADVAINNKTTTDGFLYMMETVFKYFPYTHKVACYQYSEANENLYKFSKTIKTQQDFINYVYKKYGKSEAILKFEDFLNVYNDDDFIEDGYTYDGYIITTARNAWIGKPQNQKIKTKEHLFRTFWNEKMLHMSPQNNIIFKPIGNDANGDVQLLYHGGDLWNGKEWNYFDYKNFSYKFGNIAKK